MEQGVCKLFFEDICLQEASNTHLNAWHFQQLVYSRPLCGVTLEHHGNQV
jgi:hypothetical protein